MNLKLKERENIDIPTKEKYRQQIEEEILEGRELYALILTHGYIETFLREILYLLSGDMGKADTMSKTMLKKIKRISFDNILVIHTAMNTINKNLYLKIITFNKIRNTLTHDLAKYDLSDKNNKEVIREHIENGLFVCDKIYDIYINELTNLRAEHNAEIMKDIN